MWFHLFSSIRIVHFVQLTTVKAVSIGKLLCNKLIIYKKKVFYLKLQVLIVDFYYQPFYWSLTQRTKSFPRTCGTKTHEAGNLALLKQGTVCQKGK